MSCGCGCNGHGGCGKPTNGMMMVGSFGPPSSVPLTGMHGLGDIWSDSGMTDPTTDVTPVDYGVFNTPVPYTPAGVTPTTAPSSTTNLLDSLAASWSAAAQQILKSNAGALPTYQQVGPGGTTTVYGNAANIPTSLTTALTSLTTGSGSILLIGGLAILAIMAISKK